jgi:hypothetical protein
MSTASLSERAGPVAAAQVERVGARARKRQAAERRAGQRDTRPPLEAFEELLTVMRAWDRRLPDEIAGVYKNGESYDAEYGLILRDRREVPIGNAEQLGTPRRFCAAIRGGLGMHVAVPKEAWGNAFELLHAAAELRDVEAGDVEIARGWLASMWERGDSYTIDPTDTEAMYQALRSGAALIVFPDRTVNVRPDELLGFIGRAQGGKHVPSPADLSKRLGALGFRRARLEQWHPDKPRSGGDRARLRVLQSRPGFDLDG